MPIGSGIIYNAGDLILSQVSGSGNTFLETKIAAATSSIVYFDNTARINSASLNSITVGTASYVSGSTSIITNLTASNISASGTGSFGIVGIGTTSPAAKLDVSANAVDIAIFRSSGGLSNDKRLTITSGGEKVIFNVSDNSNTAIARAYEFQNAGTASMTLNSTGSLQVVNTGRIIGIIRASSTPQTTFYDNTFAVNSDGGGANGFIYTSGTGGTFPLDFYGELILQSCPRTGYNNGISLVTGTTSPSVKLRVAENGNVGIGTSSPASKLHISGSGQTIMRLDSDTTSSVSQFQIKAASDAVLIMGMQGGSAASTNFGVTAAGQAYFGTSTLGSPHPTSLVIGNVSNIPIAFSTNNVERMRIDGGGNVGIGTTTVSRKLHTYVTTGPAMRLETSGSNASIEFIPSTGHNRYNWLIGAQQNISDAFEITPSTATNGTTFSTPSLLVKSDGNVGIGTTAPTARLHVSGSTGGVFEVDTAGGTTTLYVSASGNVGIGTTNPTRLLQVNSDALIYANVAGAVTGSKLLFGSFANTTAAAIYSQTTTATSGDLIFAPMSASILTEFVRIQSTGNVGIGTASPADKLHVIGNIRINGGDILNWGGQAFIQTIGANDMFFRPNSTLRMILTAAGNLGLGNGFTSPAYLLDVSGSSRHGYQTADTHQFTGSVSVSGSLNATASWASNAVSASFATTAQTANALNVANTYTIAGLTSAYVDVNGSGTIPTTGIYRPSTKTLGLSADGTLIFKISNVSSPATSSIETGNFVVQSGNFGLGTNSPNNKLDIFGGTGTTLNMSNVDDGNRGGKLTFISSSATGRQFYVGTNSSIYNLVFGIDSIEKARIDTNGNLGIGTTNPAATLHVSGSSGATATFQGSTQSTMNLKVGSFDNYLVGTSTGDISIRPSGSTAVTILSNGSVGIGTTSPANKLYVVSSGSPIARFDGSSVAASSATEIDILGPQSNGDLNLGIGGSTFTDATNNIQNKAYITAGTGLSGLNLRSDAGYVQITAGGVASSYEVARFTSAGNVGIGTTAPAAKLEISGSSNSALMNIKSPISGAILYVSGSGAVGIGTSNVGAYTLQVNGSFAATTKSFVIEHPTKAGKKLIYGSLESPYHGIRLTGRDTLVNGKCKIQLPDYIYKLILHDSVNIQLTGIKCNKTLYVDDINIPENYFTIAYDKAIFESYKDYEFFWDFTAIRADVPELTTEL